MQKSLEFTYKLIIIRYFGIHSTIEYPNKNTPKLLALIQKLI